MDVRKEYDAKIKAEKTEQAADRLSKSYRLWLYLPVYSVACAFVTYLMPVSVGIDVDFSGMLTSLSNPVLLAIAVFMVGSGVIYDKNSARLYQAVCAPVESVNIDYLKKLNDVRKRTARIVVAVNIIAFIFASKQFLTGNRSYELTYMACLMNAVITRQTAKDGDLVIEKLEADMTAENTAEEQ